MAVRQHFTSKMLPPPHQRACLCKEEPRIEPVALTYPHSRPWSCHSLALEKEVTEMSSQPMERVLRLPGASWSHQKHKFCDSVQPDAPVPSFHLFSDLGQVVLLLRAASVSWGEPQCLSCLALVKPSDYMFGSLRSYEKHSEGWENRSVQKLLLTRAPDFGSQHPHKKPSIINSIGLSS